MRVLGCIDRHAGNKHELLESVPCVERGNKWRLGTRNQEEGNQVEVP